MFSRLALLAVLIGLGAIIGLVVLVGDRSGGVPFQRVAITIAPSRPPVSASVDSGPAASVDRSRRSADEVESASGVSVVRPVGTSAPEAVIVRVPDEAQARLRPAPDPRLVERTRHGALPRIGADGSRPVDHYARPPGTLSGGRVPVARIALLVGGLGISQAATAEAIARLPAPVSLGFAPYGTDLGKWAARAREAGHEVFLQVPMEPYDYPDSDPGPHTLTAAASPAEMIERLHWALGRLVGYVGIVNHMGAKLTANERALAPIVDDVARRGLAIVDDGTSSRSVLSTAAHSAPFARATIVVDAVASVDEIDRALERLIVAASRGEAVLGSASATPLTIDRISRWSRGLEARGILLLPVTATLRPASPVQSAGR